MENEEVIRRRMEHTREALTEKLETLEQKLTGTVSAVADTVANVQEKVQAGVETVKEAVDVQAHVEHHPWLALGGSVFCGYLLGNMLLGQKKKPFQPEGAPRPAEKANGFARPPQEKPPAPTAEENWLGAFEPEVQHLKSLALGVTLGTVREMLTEQFLSPHMADHLRNIIDAVTKKAGGEPIPSSDWTAAKSATPPHAQPEPSFPS